MRNNILSAFKHCGEVVRENLMDVDMDLGKTVGMGADGTPIKALDQMAEESAVEVIKERIGCSILSEEAGFIEGDSSGVVILDPIDGTGNALLGIPFYSISMAYTTSDLAGVEVGYVENLSSGKEYYAVKGHGYTGKKLFDREKMTFSVYLGKEAHPDNFKVARIPRRARLLGSAALEISMVADGIFDIYFMKTQGTRRSLRITDIAASTLILREAGGQVYGDDFQPLNMPLDPTIRRDIIAVRDPKLLEVLSWA